MGVLKSSSWREGRCRRCRRADRVEFRSLRGVGSVERWEIELEAEALFEKSGAED